MEIYLAEALGKRCLQVKKTSQVLEAAMVPVGQ